MISDPFTLGDVEDGNIAPLTNIATGVVMPHDDAIRLLQAFKLGATQMSTFLEERINSNRLKLWDTIPHLNI